MKKILLILTKNIAVLIPAMFFVADRLFKTAAASGAFFQPLKLIGDIFTLNFVTNYYIAFSLPITGKILLVVDSLLIIGLLYFALESFKKNKSSETMAFLFIAFGAISNLLDRMFLGYVVDYFDLKFFTVFNIADLAILFGIIYWLILDRQAKKNN
jgi:signal peptidase II